MSKKIYIAGPMTGLPNFNREAFHEMAELIKCSGDIPLNPAHLPDGMSQFDYMTICVSMVQVADCVIMLKDWLKSEGARIEHDLAKKCGKEIIYQ
ncbi:hypothetical protein phiP47_070 [Plesiomonas phage phiP4-7]|nr:hypothetical protein phiP47_070 [Plesiomonas phage phiP4-7]